MEGRGSTECLKNALEGPRPKMVESTVLTYFPYKSMDSYGKLQLCWQSGSLPVHPSQISFLSEHTLIYSAGASINLMDLDTGKINRFGKETGPVSCLAVYRHKPWIAFAQLSVEPQLSLLDEKGGVVGRFPAGAKLEYTSLIFSDDGK